MDTEIKILNLAFRAISDDGGDVPPGEGPDDGEDVEKTEVEAPEEAPEEEEVI